MTSKPGRVLSQSVASAPHVTGGPPVSFLVVTQNIGTIDCSNIKQQVTDDIKLMTETFIESLRLFICEAAKAKVADASAPTSQAAAAADAAAPSAGAAKVTQIAATAEPQIDVVVVHVQEIGGKKYNAVFNEYLAQQVCRVYPNAGWCSGLLMQAQNCDTTFTAMGAIIFVSKRLVPVTSVLSIRHRTYISLVDDPATYVGGLTYLFHGGKFSNAEKSRKGFLLTSLRIGSMCMNFCNLHLYHDADNAVAVQSSPSKYTTRRQEAFLEAMSEILPIIDLRDPLILFGDFNTRLDASRLLQFIKQQHDVDVIMGKKEVTAPPTFWNLFSSEEARQKLFDFDAEPAIFMDKLAQEAKLELAEMPVKFGPTYLLEDGHESGEQFEFHPPAPGDVGRKKDRPFKHERIPAWCDRIWLNPAAVDLLSGRTTESKSKMAEKMYLYDSVTLEKMDHEAVFLLF